MTSTMLRAEWADPESFNCTLLIPMSGQKAVLCVLVTLSWMFSNCGTMGVGTPGTGVDAGKVMLIVVPPPAVTPFWLR